MFVLPISYQVELRQDRIDLLDRNSFYIYRDCSTLRVSNFKAKNDEFLLYKQLRKYKKECEGKYGKFKSARTQIILSKPDVDRCKFLVDSMYMYLEDPLFVGHLDIQGRKYDIWLIHKVSKMEQIKKYSYSPLKRKV